MALKKKTSKLKGKQLYMFEVLVDQLNLIPDKISEMNATDFLVRVEFIDLAPHEIKICKNINEDNIKENQESKRLSMDFKYGKSSLFTKAPGTLIKDIKMTPLRINVYAEKPNDTGKNDQILLCSAKKFLPSCLCNQVRQAKKETKGLQAPCVVNETYDLNDAKNEPFGTVSLILRLSCYGDSAVEHFALEEASFELQDEPFREKFLCAAVIPKSTEDEKEDLKVEEVVLKRPDSPPRISMGDPGFENLTTSEKLNDPKYRGLIYRTYPDEPTCKCLPKPAETACNCNPPKHPIFCPSGCVRPCCMRLRDPKSIMQEIENSGANGVPTYCVKPSDFKADAECLKRSRLRGGADVQQLYLGPGVHPWAEGETDGAWYDDKFPAESRLEGGGERSCTCSGGKAYATPLGDHSWNDGGAGLGIQDACKPRLKTEGPQPKCSCPGKDISTWKTGSAKCTKKPCQGVECMVRAFESAQNFVNSLGKVPGLAGLGLMDPSESPYFGIDTYRDYPMTPDSQMERKKAAHSHMCNAPCSSEVGRPGAEGLPISYRSTPLSMPLTAAPRAGIVREGIPILPASNSGTMSSKLRKKDDKKEDRNEKYRELLDTISSGAMNADVGPCGEPKCKSRRKKSIDHNQQNQKEVSIDASVKKPPPNHETRAQNTRFTGAIGERSTKSQMKSSKHHGAGHKVRKEFGGILKSHVGPAGDRNASYKSPFKISKRVMRYVYSLGDYYPGVNFGHKNCLDLRLRVPANMGWLWNTSETGDNLKPRIGWKPGAIGRNLFEMLQEAKQDSLSMQDISKDAGKGRQAGASVAGSNRARSVPSRSTRKPKQQLFKSRSFASVKKMQSQNEGIDETEPPPTLHIHRKDGTYYVTMYPIKQETGEEVSQLAEPMKPLQFKIVKNKDDASGATSSTASDMEIEFSPPAAMTRQRKRPDVVHVDTQVRQQEILDAIKPAESNKKKEKKGKKEKKAKI